MLAIVNSRDAKPFHRLQFSLKSRFLAILTGCSVAGWIGFVVAGVNAFAGDYTQPRRLGGKAEFAHAAQKAYEATKARFEAEPTNAEAAWQLGRTCYDWADYASSSSQRAEIAE